MIQDKPRLRIPRVVSGAKDNRHLGGNPTDGLGNLLSAEFGHDQIENGSMYLMMPSIEGL